MSRNKFLTKLEQEEVRNLNAQTISHYERSAHEFLEATRQHDVSQNIEALLRNITGVKPFDILDLGCGPGRDLLAFKALGHRPIGLDGCAEFVKIAKARARCETLRIIQEKICSKRFVLLVNRFVRHRWGSPLVR